MKRAAFTDSKSEKTDFFFVDINSRRICFCISINAVIGSGHRPRLARTGRSDSGNRHGRLYYRQLYRFDDLRLGQQYVGRPHTIHAGTFSGSLKHGRQQKAACRQVGKRLFNIRILTARPTPHRSAPCRSRPQQLLLPRVPAQASGSDRWL